MPGVGIIGIGFGGGGAKKLRHDYQPEGSPETFYSYIGTANKGTLESAEKWFITRITHFPNGTTATATAEDVAWTDRLTVIYS